MRLYIYMSKEGYTYTKKDPINRHFLPTILAVDTQIFQKRHIYTKTAL